MCIISALPKGTEKNSEKVKKFIKNGFSCNQDGSGFMFKRNNESTITINKGFFNLTNLLDAIEKEKLTIDDELVIHHRISTAGKTSRENCHPFVLSKNHAETAAVSININKPCLTHNGHFSKLSYFQDLDRDFSDTYAFSRYILSNQYLRNIMDTDEDLFSSLTEHIIGSSKICILFPEKDRQMLIWGNFVEDEGYYHSNSGYCNNVFDYGGFSRVRRNKNSQFSEWNEGYDTTILDSSEAYWEEIQAARLEQEEKEKIARNKVLIEDKNLISVDNKLDGSTIYLTNKNCTHFQFISKEDYKSGLLNRKLEFGNVSNFDPDSEMQSIEYRKEGKPGLNIEAVLTTVILKDYWFLPKMMYSTTYTQYLKLSLKITDIGKQTLKKLNHLLEKNVNLTNDKCILYSRLDAYFLKSSLIAYRDNLEYLLKLQEDWEKKEAKIISINSSEDAINNKAQIGIIEALKRVEEEEEKEENEKNSLQTIVDHLEINT